MPKCFPPLSLLVRGLCLLLLFARGGVAVFLPNSPPHLLVTLPKILEKDQQHSGFVLVDKHLVLLRVEALNLRSFERRPAASPGVVRGGYRRFPLRLPFQDYTEDQVGIGLILHDCSKSKSEAACRRQAGPVISHAWSRVAVRQVTPLLLLIDVSQAVFLSGELVRFRVTAVRPPDLLPVKDAVLDLALEGPDGEVAAEWRNTSWEAAIQGFSYQLGRDVPEGRWAVAVTSGPQRYRRTFLVLGNSPARVLVEPKPPKFLRADAKFVAFAVCARASDSGLPVLGHVIATLCVRSKRYPIPDASCVRVQEHFTAQDECLFFNESTRPLGLLEPHRAPRFTHLKAEVTARGGLSVTEASFGGPLISFAYTVRLKLPGALFHVGLPFFGRVRTSMPDGRSLSEGKVRLELRPRRGPGLLYADIFTTDLNGDATFVIPPTALSGRRAAVVRVSTVGSVQKGLKERWDIKVIRKSASYPGESLQLLEPVLRRSHNRCQARHIRLRLQADFPLLNHKLHVLTLGANDVTEHQVLTISGRPCSDRRESGFGHYRCRRRRRRWLARCSYGWSGPNCLEPLCSDGCVRGVCVRPETCVCERGWAGRACNRCVKHRRCRHGYCHRGGDCACLPGWTGPFCDHMSFAPVYRLLRPGVKLTPRRIRYPTRRRLERISLFTTDLLVRLQRPLGKASFVLIYLSRLRSDGRTDWLSASARLPSSPGCALQRTEASFSFDAPVVRPGQKVRAKISVEGDEIFCALAIRDVRGGPLPLTSDFSTTEVLRRINRDLSKKKTPEKDSCDEKSPASSLADSGFQQLGNSGISPCWNYTDPSGWWRCEEAEQEKEKTWDRQDDLSTLDDSLRTDSDDASEELWEEMTLKPLWQPLWLFRTLHRPPSVLKLDVPHSPATWRANFLCLSSHGLAIAPSVSLVVYHPFQVRVLLPASLRLGETLVLPVRVRSFDAACLWIHIEWRRTDRVKLHTAWEKRVCLCEYAQRNVKFTVTPKMVGNASITLHTIASAPHSECKPWSNQFDENTNVDVVKSRLIVLRSSTKRLRSSEEREDLNFHLQSDILDSGSNCSRRLLRLCMRHRGASIQRVMVLLKAQMASGWQISSRSVARLRNSMRVHGLRRVSIIEDDTLVMFYDFLSTFTSRCAKIDLLKIFVVADLQPMLLQAFDVSHPDLSLQQHLYLHTKKCLPLRLRRKNRKKAPVPTTPPIPLNCPKCQFDRSSLITLLTAACEFRGKKQWQLVSARYSSYSAIWYLMLLEESQQLRWTGSLLLSHGCPCHLSRQLLLIGYVKHTLVGRNIHLNTQWHVIDSASFGEELREISDSGLCTALLKYIV